MARRLRCGKRSNLMFKDENVSIRMFTKHSRSQIAVIDFLSIFFICARVRPVLERLNAEVDLAMLSLFGRVPETFYRAYGQNPRAADFQHRVRLYNLYHLLNHFNLFGGGYAGAVADSATALLRD